MHSDDERIAVSIRDDGVGLPADWARPGHFGLRGLAQRIEHLGGTFSVANCPTRGVQLQATIPLGLSQAPGEAAPRHSGGAR